MELSKVNNCQILRLHEYCDSSGTVTLSPSGVAPVCSEDQLELMCTVTGALLQWRFSTILGELTRTITSTGPAMSQLTVLSTVFNFSRISADSSMMPVVSRLVISPVSNRLNGTVMNCVNAEAGEVASTTIIVGERGALQGILCVIQLYSYFCHTLDITPPTREHCYNYSHNNNNNYVCVQVCSDLS